MVNYNTIFRTFIEKSFKNLWWFRKKCVPLHSLLRNTPLTRVLSISGAIKKEFFEKIYINRK